MEMKETILKFGGDVKNSAEKIAKGAFDGSKKIAEKAKIKHTISQEESKLNATYIEIGKKYEEIYGSKEESEFSQLLADVAAAKAQIAAARAELAAIDSVSICASCGKNVQEGQRFCPYCGAKQEKEEAAEPVQSSETVVVDADGSEVANV
jgi:rubrerythrin